MEQFSLDKWLQDKSRKVVTRRGNPVRIICTDRKHGEDDLPIVFLEENNGGEFLLTCRNDGRCDNYDTQYDLFFADEGEELTKFEKGLQTIISEASHWTSDDGSISTYCQFGDKEIKKISTQVLDLARKELKPEFGREMDKMLAETDKYNRDSIIALIQWSESFNSSGMTHDKANQLITWVNSYNPYDIWCHKDSKTFNPTQNQAEFEKGKQDALKSLPKWKKCVGSTGPFIDYNSKDEAFLYLNDYVIKVSELEKLPKEEQL